MKKIVFLIIPMLIGIISVAMFLNFSCNNKSSFQLSNSALAFQNVYSTSQINNFTDDERLDMLVKEVVKKYPNSHEALRVRLQVCEKKYWDEHISGVTNLIFNQGQYRKKKKLLEYHTDSTYLLLHLSSLGYMVYPKETASYCDRVISINPNIAEAYELAGKSYSILGNFDTALLRFEAGRDILINRLIPQLKRRIPYKNSVTGLPGFYASQINFAKSYFRDLGYEVGKDVDYDLDKMRSGKGLFFTGTIRPMHARASFILSDNVRSTAILDLHRLDYILKFIKHIKEGSPIFSPYNRVSVSEHPLKKLIDN